MRASLILMVLALASLIFTSLAAAANDAPLYRPARPLNCVGCGSQPSYQPSYPQSFQQGYSQDYYPQPAYQQGFQSAPCGQSFQSGGRFRSSFGGRPRFLERLRSRRGCR